MATGAVAEEGIGEGNLRKGAVAVVAEGMDWGDKPGERSMDCILVASEYKQDKVHNLPVVLACLEGSMGMVTHQVALPP